MTADQRTSHRLYSLRGWRTSSFLRSSTRGLGLTKFVEQFAAQLTSVEPQVLADLRAFVDWQTQTQGGTFIPQTVDDVAIRSYLLHLRLSRVSRSILQRTIDSLKRFYDWAQVIAKSRFDSFDFNRPLLSREQIKHRQETRCANVIDREIAHLRALNHLAEHLNRSADIHTLLATVVETLVQGLQSPEGDNRKSYD